MKKPSGILITENFEEAVKPRIDFNFDKEPADKIRKRVEQQIREEMKAIEKMRGSKFSKREVSAAVSKAMAKIKNFKHQENGNVKNR